LPIKITREYRIFFIGEDGGADVVLKNSKMPINCPENISFAASKGHVKTIFGAVDITKYN